MGETPDCQRSERGVDILLLRKRRQTLAHTLAGVSHFLVLFLILILQLTFLCLGTFLDWDGYEIGFLFVLGIFLPRFRLWLVSSRNLLKWEFLGKDSRLNANIYSKSEVFCFLNFKCINLQGKEE